MMVQFFTTSTCPPSPPLSTPRFVKKHRAGGTVSVVSDRLKQKMASSQLLLLLAVQLVVLSGADAYQQNVDFTLQPSTTEIKFFQYTLDSPGTFDLSNLQFATDSNMFPMNSDTEHSVVDVIEFRSDHPCEDTQDGCGEEWYCSAGVGEMYQNDSGTTMQWCCTEEAYQDGLCDISQLNRLIVKSTNDVSSGVGRYHRTIEVPTTVPYMDASLGYSKLFRSEGVYVILLAHCNPNGRPLQVLGSWGVTTENNDKGGDNGDTSSTSPADRPFFRDDLDLLVEPYPSKPHFFQHVWPTAGNFDMSRLIFSTPPGETFYPPNMKDSVVSVIEFRADNFCAGASWETCASKWSTSSGIGALGSNGEVQLCCTSEAIDEGLCDTAFRDELIVDPTISAAVFHRKVVVPKENDLHTSLHNADLFRAKGVYIVILVNCNPNGRIVQVTGQWEFTEAIDDSNNQQTQTSPTTTTAPPPSPAASPTIHSLPTRPEPSRTSPPNNKGNDIVESEVSTEEVTPNPLVWPALAMLVLVLIVIIVLERIAQYRKYRSALPHKIQSKQDVQIDFDCLEDDSEHPPLSFPETNSSSQSHPIPPIT